MASSDSDSSGDEFQAGRVTLPSEGNLAKLRKQKQSANRNNLKFAKAAVTGKKFTKSVRFPDSYGPRDTIISNNSSTNYSSDSGLEDLDEVSLHRSPGDSGSNINPLPNFSSKGVSSTMNLGEEYEDDDDNNDDSDDYLNRYNQQLNADSDDSDSDANSNSTGPFKDQQKEESDITDLSREPDEERSAFRSILRKMSLVDQAYSNDEYSGRYGAPEGPSASDSFLGRVLAFSKEAGAGLSGGGLIPGASHRPREAPIDEEMDVGMPGGDGDPESVEMSRLDFAQLDREAQNLILSHIPNAHSQNKKQRDADREERTSIAHDPVEGSSADPPASSDSSAFYTPNPDILMHRDEEAEFDPHDEFMLDDVNQDGYIARPKQVHAGVLSSLLRLYQNPNATKSSTSFLSRASTGGTTLAEESAFDEELDAKIAHKNHPIDFDFSKLKRDLKSAPKRISNKFPSGRKSGSATPIERSSDEHTGDEKSNEYIGEANELPSFHNARPKQPKKSGPPTKANLSKMKHHKAQRLRITVHIADILQRQRFIMRMCRALMLFGAPTHRLEEYMVMTSRVLEIDGQFIYFPGCMIVAFGDAATRTSEVHLVRCAQGLNLSKLSDTHKIYKAVIHDLIGVEEAAKQLDSLLRSKNMYPPWLCVLFYALGSAMVCPFAFGGGWIDLPIAFGVGLCVGYLQFYVSSKSNLYSSVFEVTASIVVAFISRAIGSIKGGDLFCFSAIAQGSLALILPGYIILCGSLELQSRNLVAGSVRMFYAIIYSLFLGFGITLGGALYGWVDSNATSANTCGTGHSTNDKWRILFVPLFSVSLGLINQARWRQLPIQTFISSVGYIGTYFAGKHFSSVTEFTACIGAFIVGILGNLYSRVGKGMAVSAMLPAIFVQVPSGIASQSSLVSGIQSADQITGSNTTTTTTTTTTASMSFGVAMVEVSIGISVGLFAAALVVYPFGKKRTGLFTL